MFHNRTAPNTACSGQVDMRCVFTCACGKVQAGSLHGSKLVPVKQRSLLPPRRIEPVEITAGIPKWGRCRTPLGASAGWESSLCLS
jgi:hypothetical protein